MQAKYKNQQPWQSYFGQPRFYLYQGNDSVGREESDSFDSKREAIARAKLVIEEAKYSLLPTSYGFRVDVVDRKTGEFIHTESL
jgi:hypothetical protein